MRALSLRWRLTLLLASATSVALGVATWIVDLRSDSEMQQRFDSALLARAQELAASVRVESGGNNVEASPLASSFLSAHADIVWYDLRCNGNTVLSTRIAPPPSATSAEPRFFDARLPDGRKVREISFRFGLPGDADGRTERRSPGDGSICDLRYAQDRAPLDEILHSLDWILLGTLFGACALVLLLTPWLVRRGLRPLSVLATAMADIGPDAPGRRLPNTGARELAPLAARFNDVLARMDSGLAREREFAAGLAHELRTRLTELRTLVEIEMRYPSGRDMHDLLGDAGAIGVELEATVTALLQLTRIESGLSQVRRESVALVPLLQRAQSRHDPAAMARGVRIEFTAQSDVMLSTDPALLEIVIDNLVDNAVSYATEPRVVAMSLRAGAIEVINPASELRAEDLSNFGRRFWRRSDGAEGHTGLGLALASAAARVQRFDLSFALDEQRSLHAVLRWED